MSTARRALAGAAAAQLWACGGAGPERGPVLDQALLEPASAWQTLRAPSMATVFEINLPSGPSPTAGARAAFAVFDEVERRMNEWRPESELGTVNRGAGGAAIPVSVELFAGLTQARALAEKTGGTFDPTWAALWGLWDFRLGAAPRVPDAEAVARQVALVGWQRLHLEPATRGVRLADKGMALGLGGIAKGWALDRAAEALARHGVADALLSAGGQLLALGRGPHGPWLAGLRDPRGESNDIWATLQLQPGESLATSGDYERFFDAGGVRYHHVLDPRTGWPTKGTRAAVVLARSATLADALGKPLMILGKAGLQTVVQWGATEALVVDEAGHWHATDGMRQRLRVLRQPLP
ncbi:MAG: FAD:protein FMN transferase [Deltaproteobacteria bacterium]|nr:FAD:protein FMN transferase [Deltaproteobacteria bacterium]